MNEQNGTLKRAMLEALEKCLGIVSDAVKIVGIGRTTHYSWMKDDPEYKQAVESIDDIALDFAESKLHERMRGVEMAKIGSDGEMNTYTLPPDTTAIIFYLKTKGKKRGFVERQEVTGPEGEKLSISINVLGNSSPITKEED